MTKKHFEAAAKIINELEVSEDDRGIVALQFANLFETTNPRFDRSRFIAACMVGK